MKQRRNETYEEFRARANAADRQRYHDRKWQVVKEVRGSSGELISSVTVPQREPFKQTEGLWTKGKSTLVDSEGNVIQTWHKETAQEKERLEVLMAVIGERVKGIPPLELLPVPDITTDRLMSIYPIGDHHLGMLAWKYEVGHSYDIEIGEALLASAVNHLVGLCSGYGTALVVFLGDFLHYDSMVAETPKNNNPLDADGRFPKLMAAAQRAVERTILTVAEHHEDVRVIFSSGNHDPASTVAIRLMIARLFENNPRIHVDISPSHFHYHKFGKNLVGVTHGDTVKKLESLPGIMAYDEPESWGQTEHRIWLTGHIHTQKWFDYPGCSVESFRILAPNDAWAHEHGYRAKREMKAIVLDTEYGEVARYGFNPAMMER